MDPRKRKQSKLLSSATDNKKKKDNYLVNFSVNDMDEDDVPVKKSSKKKPADDFLIDDDDFSEDFGQDKVSDIVVERVKIPKGKIHATFHKTRCCSYTCLQVFRVVSFLSCLPVCGVSIWMNGIEYFIEYVTQWTTMMTIIYFFLVFISARKDRALDVHAAQLNALDDEMSVNTVNQHSKY